MNERSLQAIPALKANNLVKEFFGVRVLHGISLELYPGKVHGLVGENGAGKSTLMKILAGVYQADGGSVELAGTPVNFTHPVQAMDAGVATVFQEFNLLPERTVAQNIFIGREPRKAGFVDQKAMVTATTELLQELGIDYIDPTSRVSRLSVAEQQIVEIVKALSHDAKVISMDEPTAALAGHEVELLYGIIHKLVARGVAILYVSHRLREIFDLCDHITVLKDGAFVASHRTEELDTAELVRLMVGRSINTYFPPAIEGTSFGETRLAIEEGGNNWIDGINLELTAGRITGLAGLQGAGRTELAEAIFGATPFTRGTLRIDGQERKITSIRAAVKAGIALITEDRKVQGLALGQSVLNNALLAVRSVFPRRAATATATLPGVLNTLELSSRGTDQEVQYLSGGNQQKVVLAKWLLTNPKIVVLDEPTRGIDVGAKVGVYQLIRELAHDGVAILLISSELPELIGMADTILAMHDGRIVAELPAGSSEQDVLAAAVAAPVGGTA